MWKISALRKPRSFLAFTGCRKSEAAKRHLGGH